MSSSSSSSSSTGAAVVAEGESELAGVSQVLLDHLSLLEGDIGDSGNGEQVLHAVDNGVRRGGHGGVSNLQAHSRNVGNTCTIIR